MFIGNGSLYSNNQKPARLPLSLKNVKSFLSLKAGKDKALLWTQSEITEELTYEPQTDTM